MSMGNATHWTPNHTLRMYKQMIRTSDYQARLEERRGPPEYDFNGRNQEENKSKRIYQ